MAIASAVTDYFQENSTQYDLLYHEHSESAAQSALLAHIPMSQMAKAVVLRDDQGKHLMAVLPALNRLKIKWLSDMLGCNLEFVKETELSELFQDCETGAIPAIGDAYHIDSVWDVKLIDAADIYIESGDHEQLIHMTRDQFLALMANHRREEISTTW